MEKTYRSILNTTIFNYLYYFVHVYWVFFLSFVGATPFVIASVLSVSGFITLLISIFYKRFRAGFRQKSTFQYVVLFNFVEISGLLILAFGILQESLILVIFGLIFYFLFYKLKSSEFNMSFLQICSNLDEKLSGKLFNHKQSIVEIGYGISLSVVGLVTFVAQKGMIDGFSYKLSLFFCIITAIILSVIYTFKLHKLSKKLSFKPIKIEPEKVKSKKISIKNFNQKTIFAVFAIFIIYAFTYSEDTLSSSLYLSVFGDNSTMIFGIQNLFTIFFSVTLLKVSEKWSNNSKFMVAGIALVFGLSILSTNQANIFLILIYAVCTSFFTLHYASRLLIIKNSLKLSDHGAVALDSLMESGVILFGSYFVYLPFSYLSPIMFFIYLVIVITTSLLYVSKSIKK